MMGETKGGQSTCLEEYTRTVMAGRKQRREYRGIKGEISVRHQEKDET